MQTLNGTKVSLGQTVRLIGQCVGAVGMAMIEAHDECARKDQRDNSNELTSTLTRDDQLLVQVPCPLSLKDIPCKVQLWYREERQAIRQHGVSRSIALRRRV